ncbi:MAG: diguanylate cyclase [Solirubrobacterales bacterium]
MTKNIVEFINFNRDALDLIMDLVPIPLFVKDYAGLYIDCNNAFSEFLSISREKIIGKSVYELWRKEEADIFFAKDKELYEQGGLQIYEAKITSADGKPLMVQFYKQVFYDTNGSIAGFLGAIFDITEKKELENALAKQATTDELTGIPNRRYGMEKLETLHKECQGKKQSYCIAMLDLDYFKRINDMYGHNNGDIVLKTFAKLVSDFLRNGDICFRYGGEEFVVFMPDTEIDEGFAVVEKLRKAWASSKVPLSNCEASNLTVSIGITQYPGNNMPFELLLQTSDKALYYSKNGGRNQTTIIPPELI